MPAPPDIAPAHRREARPEILTGQQWNKSGHDGRRVVTLPPFKSSI